MSQEHSPTVEQLEFEFKIRLPLRQDRAPEKPPDLLPAAPRQVLTGSADRLECTVGEYAKQVEKVAVLTEAMQKIANAELAGDAKESLYTIRSIASTALYQVMDAP